MYNQLFNLKKKKEHAMVSHNARDFFKSFVSHKKYIIL